MILADLISEIGLELDRSDIDARIKRWIQSGIDALYNELPVKALETVATLTTVADVETLALPLDFGELVSLEYTPGTGAGRQLNRISPAVYFKEYADQNASSFIVSYCIYNDKLYLAPIPADVYTLTIRYRQQSANIYAHVVNVIHSATAATAGVAVYLDEDAEDTGVGRLYFVSPTTTNAKIDVLTADGHIHTITIYHNANAATLGVRWYFDEDGAGTGPESTKNVFVSPTGKDSVVPADSNRKHKHYLPFFDFPTASSLGVGVYCDEDATTKSSRLLFVSPTTTSGVFNTALSKDFTVPPFAEVHHQVIFYSAVAQGLRFDRKYAEATAMAAEHRRCIDLAFKRERRNKVLMVPAKPFSSYTSPWESLKYPEID